jgi:hypothetical protein
LWGFKIWEELRTNMSNARRDLKFECEIWRMKRKERKQKGIGKWRFEKYG